MSFANARTEASELTSMCFTMSCLLPVSTASSSRACLAVSMFRQAMMMRAPRRARSRAVSLPMPELAPVMMTVLPSILRAELNCPQVRYR
uniref:Putative secreted protein n=1 Tax=Anopheles triannulatus TaxID=58253 RepID=A0A2M4B2N9_9DIPT